MKAKEVFVLIGLIVMAPFIWLFWSIQPEKVEMSQSEKDAGTIRLVCMETNRANLHDPSSAQWSMGDDGWFQKWPVKDDGETLSVIAKFRAKNKLGAIIVAGYTCEAKRINGELKFTGASPL